MKLEEEELALDTASRRLPLPSFAPSPSALPCLLGLPRFLSSLPPSSPAFVQRVRPMLNQSRGSFRRAAKLTHCCVNVVPRSAAGAGVVRFKPRAHVQPLEEKGRGCVQRCLSRPHGAAGAGAERPTSSPWWSSSPSCGHSSQTPWQLLAAIPRTSAAFGAEAALSMRTRCPSWVKASRFSFHTHSSTHRDSSFVSSVLLRPAARLRSWHCSPCPLQHCSSFPSHPQMCVSS